MVENRSVYQIIPTFLLNLDLTDCGSLRAAFLRAVVEISLVASKCRSMTKQTTICCPQTSLAIMADGPASACILILFHWMMW